MMLYGLSGASSTGKSTLARALAENLDLALVETSITGMGLRAGFNPVERLSLFQRIELQKSLYGQFETLLKEMKGPAILDRTPLDLVMYMLAEIDMHSGKDLPAETLDWINHYVNDCLVLTERYFDHVFVTCPLPHYEAAGTRPPVNPAYQTHCQLILLGLIHGTANTLKITTLQTTDLSERLDVIGDTIADRLDFIEKQRRSSLHIH